MPHHSRNKRITNIFMITLLMIILMPQFGHGQDVSYPPLYVMVKLEDIFFKFEDKLFNMLLMNARYRFNEVGRPPPFLIAHFTIRLCLKKR